MRAALGHRARPWVYLIVLGVWLSGAVWLAVHYGLRHRSAFGMMTPSPLEPWSLALHGAFAFLALGLLGWLLGTHLPPGWRWTRNRASGLAMLSAAVLLSVSGYLLYYVVDDTARQIVAVLHWGLGLAAAPAFLWHRRRSMQLRRGRGVPGSAAMRESSAHRQL